MLVRLNSQVRNQWWRNLDPIKGIFLVDNLIEGFFDNLTNYVHKRTIHDHEKYNWMDTTQFYKRIHRNLHHYHNCGWVLYWCLLRNVQTNKILRIHIAYNYSGIMCKTSFCIYLAGIIIQLYYDFSCNHRLGDTLIQIIQ